MISCLCEVIFFFPFKLIATTIIIFNIFYLLGEVLIMFIIFDRIGLRYLEALTLNYVVYVRF